MIKITSRKDGFRRCGVAHPSMPAEHSPDAFTQEQLAELMAEPMLVVEVLDDQVSPPEKKNSGKKSDNQAAEE